MVTCPLEVVKTRLQSSVVTFNEANIVHANPNVVAANLKQAAASDLSIIRCIQHIIRTEGPRALFKGLGPNIIGVAPSRYIVLVCSMFHSSFVFSRAIYFCTYSQSKSFCNQRMTPDTPYVHMISAASAGFVSSTFTNPIWFIKTRMQLDVRLVGYCLFVN